MNYSERNRLLDPNPMSLEMGYERLDNGVLHIAIRTDMHNCSGAMLDWWFGSRPQTQQYVWWHPVDHIFSDWIEGTPGNAVGSIHLVEERFTTQPAEKLSIQFRDPAEFFDVEALKQARDSGALSAIICIRGGAGHDAKRTPNGEVIGTRLIHLARDTQWGTVLRSHFFLGEDLPALGVPKEELSHIFVDAQGPALLQHCYDEFTFLSRFLPSLYIGENRNQINVRPPW